MAKRDKTNKNAATDPKTDVVVQPETTPETENKNETPEIHSDSEQSTSEADNSGQNETVENPELDSENKTESVEEKRIEHGDQVGEPIERTMQRSKIAVDIFKKHSSKSVLYFTNDMIPFFDQSDAIKHAASLKDKTVVTVNKE